MLDIVVNSESNGGGLDHTSRVEVVRIGQIRNMFDDNISSDTTCERKKRVMDKSKIFV